MYSILISFIMKQNKNPGGNAPGFLLSIFGGSVMEQADVRHGHRHVVLVGRLDDIVVADGAAGLGDVGHAALVGTLDVVAEGEESIRSRATPVFLAIHALRSSRVSGSGCSVKNCCHAPSLRMSSASSPI